MDDPKDVKASGAPERAFVRLGPLALTRKLVKQSRQYGASSLGYHISGHFSSFKSTLPRVAFSNGKRLSGQQIPSEHAEVIGRAHEFLIKLGKPIVLSRYLDAFSQAEPKLTSIIMKEAGRMGVKDQYMVPVFGPHHVKGVISFGFPRLLDPTKDEFLNDLEEISASHHNRMVRHFVNQQKDIELSARENDVLNWIAKGKSTSEIAIILDISRSTVDTYTRRIFEKLHVHDRVSAAVTGLKSGLI